MEIVIEPPLIVAGQRYVGSVIVRTPKPEHVDAIYVHFGRLEAWKHGTGSHAPKARHEEALFEATIAGPVTLAAGENRFPVQFAARADLPPPYRLSPVAHDYTAIVKVTRKGWFKSRNEFKIVDLALQAVPQQGARGSPFTLASDVKDPSAPRLEVGLAARCFAAGERIDGTVALFNVDDRQAREVKVTLMPLFELRGWKQPWTMEGRPTTIAVTVPAGAAAAGFSLALPRDQPPTAGGVTHSIDWRLRIEAKGDLGIDTRIVIVPAFTRLGEVGRAPGLTESTDRDRLTAYAQRQGWQVVSSPGSGFVGDAAARWTVGPYSILVGIAHRGKQGRRVVVAIDLPPLAIARTELPGVVEWTDSRLLTEQPAPTLDDDALDAMRAALDETLRTIDRLRIAADPNAAAYSPFR